MARVSRSVTFALVVVLALATLAVLVQPRPAVAKGRPTGEVPDQFIVRLKPGVDPASKLEKIKRGGGVESKHIYRRAINGFAAKINPKKVAELRVDPDVLSIAPDFFISVAAETTPTGIRRTQANLNAFTGIDRNPTGVAVDAGVAIVDTGIDLDHPDLNVAGGVNCAIDGTSPDDLNGHGTHVAGTVGALDNDLGVVGIAPGARLYAVRVLSATGEGEFSNAICGLEWVLDHAAEIDVVNMSLGGDAPEGDCNDGSLHDAVCDVIDAGISVVVAAGNGGSDAVGDDAAGFAPASFDEVITVSAIVDTDGKPGGADYGHFFWGPDDSLARFSNRGADVDIAAPGVSIHSAWPNGYSYSDGTSMASPHVAGAAALVHAMTAGASPATVRAEILAVAWPQSSPEGFSGDTDGHPEPLLNVGALGGDPLLPIPPPPASCTIDPQVAAPSTLISIACVGFQPGEFVRAYWGTTTSTVIALFYANAAGSGTLAPRVPSTVAGVYDVIVVGGTSGKQVTFPFEVVPSVTVSPNPNTPGSYAVAWLKGFGSAEQVTLRWISETESIDLSTAAVGADGTGIRSVRLPQASRGAYTIDAVGLSTGFSASTEVTLTPALSPKSMSAQVGSKITFTISGFMPGEQVTLNWEDDNPPTMLGTVVASSTGSATKAIIVPAAAKGAHTLTAVGDQGSSASGTVTILPSVKLPSMFVQVGTPLNVQLAGFTAHEQVTVNWYDTTTTFTQIGTVTVDANGGGVLSVEVPEALLGIHKVQAVSPTSGPYISTSAYVQPRIVLTPRSGPSGTVVTAQVSGFKANETVSVRWYQVAWAYTALTSGIVSSTGSGTITFTIPANQTIGDHKVVGYGTSSYQQPSALFTVN